MPISISYKDNDVIFKCHCGKRIYKSRSWIWQLFHNRSKGEVANFYASGCNRCVAAETYGKSRSNEESERILAELNSEQFRNKIRLEIAHAGDM